MYLHFCIFYFYVMNGNLNFNLLQFAAFHTRFTFFNMVSKLKINFQNINVSHELLKHWNEYLLRKIVNYYLISFFHPGPSKITIFDIYIYEKESTVMLMWKYLWSKVEWTKSWFKLVPVKKTYLLLWSCELNIITTSITFNNSISL